MALMKFARIQLNSNGAPFMFPPTYVQTDDPEKLKAWVDEKWPENVFATGEVVSEEEFKANFVNK